jgi:hypothetical protein
MMKKERKKRKTEEERHCHSKTKRGKAAFKLDLKPPHSRPKVKTVSGQFVPVLTSTQRPESDVPWI